MTVLVTGSSRGIGAAIAEKFAVKGFDVALNYRSNGDSAAKLAERLNKEYNVKSAAFFGDVSDSASVKKMFENIRNELGEVDVLVNNAGIASQRLFTDITDEEWASTVGVSLGGAFYCSREALPHMIRQKSGAIVNISSMWGEVGASCEVHYSAAKAGVIGLTKALAKEVAPSGVRVNCVTPGVIMTDMMKDFDEKTVEELRLETPLERLGTPEDVANTVVFLAGDEAGFVTGQVVGVNGGFVI